MNKRRPDKLDAVIARNMRHYRERAGFSQERLGESIGVTFQQVQKYERHINRMLASRLFHVAKALGVLVAAFFED